MSSPIVRLSLLALALMVGGSLTVHAAEDGKPKAEGKGGRGGGPVKFLLSKSEELKLTDEQKSKLEALGKTMAEKQAAGEKPDREATKAEIGKILSPEQLAKFEESMKAMREKRGGDKKPEN